MGLLRGRIDGARRARSTRDGPPRVGTVAHAPIDVGSKIRTPRRRLYHVHAEIQKFGAPAGAGEQVHAAEAGAPRRGLDASLAGVPAPSALELRHIDVDLEGLAPRASPRARRSRAPRGGGAPPPPPTHPPQPPPAPSQNRYPWR